MYANEYYTAKREIKLQREKLKKLKRSSLNFRRELRKFIESAITVYGHAWCMDVKRERIKMAKLIVKEFRFN